MIKAFQNLSEIFPPYILRFCRLVPEVSPTGAVGVSRVQLVQNFLGSCPSRPNPHVAVEPPSGQWDMDSRVWKWLHESAWLDDPSLFWTPVRQLSQKGLCLITLSSISWATARICTAQQFSHLICILPAIVCFLLLYQSNSNLMRKGFSLMTCPNHSPSLRETKVGTQTTQEP